jgi:hypothetical protein
MKGVGVSKGEGIFGGNEVRMGKMQYRALKNEREKIREERRQMASLCMKLQIEIDALKGECEASVKERNLAENRARKLQKALKEAQSEANASRAAATEEVQGALEQIRVLRATNARLKERIAGQAAQMIEGYQNPTITTPTTPERGHEDPSAGTRAGLDAKTRVLLDEAGHSRSRLRQFFKNNQHLAQHAPHKQPVCQSGERLAKLMATHRKGYVAVYKKTQNDEGMGFSFVLMKSADADSYHAREKAVKRIQNRFRHRQADKVSKKSQGGGTA